MRTDTTFKRAFNDMIEIIRTLDLGEELPSENALRARTWREQNNGAKGAGRDGRTWDHYV